MKQTDNVIHIDRGSKFVTDADLVKLEYSSKKRASQAMEELQQCIHLAAGGRTIV